MIWILFELEFAQLLLIIMTDKNPTAAEGNDDK